VWADEAGVVVSHTVKVTLLEFTPS
jgi:hypothetical protein